MEAKQYAAVLTGAMRRLTEEDLSITAERIKQEVFPDLAQEGTHSVQERAVSHAPRTQM